MYKLLLFFPTNYRHIIDFSRVLDQLDSWQVKIICFEPYLPQPGIRMEETLKKLGLPYVLATGPIPQESWFEPKPDIVVFGAAYELLALRILCKSFQMNIPTLAIEEVAQLMLNDNKINNYSFPFDKLLVANKEEYERFKYFGYPPENLTVTGLLCYENLPDKKDYAVIRKKIRLELGLKENEKILLIVCSLLMSPMNPHSPETIELRRKMFSIVGGISGGWKKLIRLHPTEDKSQTENLLNLIPDAILCHQDVNIYHLLIASDIVITLGNTQVTLETLIAERQLAIFSPEKKYPLKGFPLFSNTSELNELLDDNVHTKVNPSNMDKYFHLPYNLASNNIAREIENVASLKKEVTAEQRLLLAFSLIEFNRNTEAYNLITNSTTRKAVILQRVLEVTLGYSNDLNSMKEIDVSDQFHLHFLAAQAYARLKKWEKGLFSLEKSATLMPPYIKLRIEPLYYNFFSFFLKKIGGTSIAINRLNSLKEIEPYSIALNIEIARLKSEDSNNNEGIINELLSSIKSHPDSPWFKIELGKIYSKNKWLHKAEEQFRSTINLFPRTPWPHHELGNLLTKTGRLDEAEVEFKKAIEIDYSLPWTHHELGNLLAKTGRLDEAEVEFKKAIEIDYSLPWTHHELGNLLAKTGRLDEAEVEFKKAIEIDYSLPWTHHELGNLLAKTGRLDEAEVEFKKAIEINPSLPWPHHELGKIFTKKGASIFAQNEFRKAINCDTNAILPQYELMCLLIKQLRIVDILALLPKLVKSIIKRLIRHFT